MNAPISTRNFANAAYGKHEFGTDTATIAQTLRDLADAIESKQVICTSATTSRTAKPDDYPLSHVILDIEFYESLDENNRV